MKKLFIASIILSVLTISATAQNATGLIKAEQTGKHKFRFEFSTHKTDKTWFILKDTTGATKCMIEISTVEGYNNPVFVAKSLQPGTYIASIPGVFETHIFKHK